jgi:hypothetical protein
VQFLQHQHSSLSNLNHNPLEKLEKPNGRNPRYCCQSSIKSYIVLISPSLTLDSIQSKHKEVNHDTPSAPTTSKLRGSLSLSRSPSGCIRQWLRLWSSWQIRRLDSVGDLSTSLSNHVLSLLGILSGIGTNRLGSTARMLSCEIAHLCSLRVDDITCLVDVLVDEFLVLEVDERGDECDGCGDETKSPEGNPLDEPV